MKIPLPNLDDRRWTDLVDEGRTLIPVFAPEWTDHNLHDPGITIIELLAWIAEMDVYRLNRISDAAKAKFFSLLGVKPYPPRSSRTVLNFELDAGMVGTLKLPSDVEFATSSAFGPRRIFRTLERLTIVPGRLVAIQSKSQQRFENLIDSAKNGEPFTAFGAEPELGSEFYLGFSQPLPTQQTSSLFLTFAGPRADQNERLRIADESQARAQACYPPPLICCEHSRQTEPPAAERVIHPSPPRARLVWEAYSHQSGKATGWMPLDPQRHEVIDDTRGLTLDGPVLLRLPRAMAPIAIGHVETELYYVRCRFQGGDFDSAPQLSSVALNGVRAEQSAPVSSEWNIEAGVQAGGPAPTPGKPSQISRLYFNHGRISELSFAGDDEHAPHFLVLAYQAATAVSKGLLSLEARFLGAATGEPEVTLNLPEAPVQARSLRLYIFEDQEWHVWIERPDFDSSSRSDAHFLLDATSGTLVFGNGDKGRVPTRGAPIFAAYRTTVAEGGNLVPRTIVELADSPHNRSVLANFDGVKKQLVKITNPVGATGGASAESLLEAQGRVLSLMKRTQRAVTLADYEELARNTPGVKLARVAAKANLHPSFSCSKALGLITVIVLPSLPGSRPMPSNRLMRTVASYLQRRRIIGTRVEVVGPTYVEVTVLAQVQALDRIDTIALQQRIVRALTSFLDPLKGGPDQTGWPFGRDVYRSEILQVLDEVAGVDYVLNLELSVDGCPPQCGNVCIIPTALVVSGSHQIEVVGGKRVSARSD